MAPQVTVQDERLLATRRGHRFSRRRCVRARDAGTTPRRPARLKLRATLRRWSAAATAQCRRQL